MFRSRIPIISKRFITTSESNVKELEKSIILGGDLTKQIKSDTTTHKDNFRLLDESIRKTELLSKQHREKISKLPPNFAKNQNISLSTNQELKSILGEFQAPIRYAFAYGSGVFSQGYMNKDTQTDLIFGVTYPDHWHSINMKLNPNHYSSLKYFGSSTVAKFQEIGAGVYFNPYVEINGKLIKYGVVSIDTLVKDLAHWETFYLAGRLQKPVNILKDDPIIKFWNQQNLRSAATLAYGNMSHETEFNEFEFFKNITKLSYQGDIRYKLGAENPKKIDKIVENNYQYFQEYYKPILNEVINQKHFVLPPGFTLDNANSKLQDIIFRNSTKQTLKGIFTAGLNKSIKYAWAKKMKSRG
ncbi:Mitochondrial import protein MMP37 [Wickerhamomyces ciferrii]|uniref:Phosphatidate cytidylyltransferase, mitochondrial n=1 Tax=Wickerhamomyces ciferrii (strain ATCC 14091 / BCRC 22168 / CBS 111 / JCM 3599 / NBRC 0793 / NRRL Y-1031 F-60-10) TaxID=1206466 RepID=K0KUK4_WICCF|nr:Mitochondrial import protein MMP37 [Wickerhamomyces ciferrii]CCH44863.1 Mitochondrial import protein MMP37 [Wickerhamomyces ciferrii]